MRKLYILLSMLLAASGLALVGIGFVLALPPAGGPAEAKSSSPAVPDADKPAIAVALEGDIVAVLSPAAVDLNSRDAMIGSEDEIATGSTSDALIASEWEASYHDNMLLNVDETLALTMVVPPAAPAPSVVANPLDWRRHHHNRDHDADDFFFHRIRFGETLSGIALRFGTTIHRLAVLNGIHNVNRIIAGRFLLIPG